MFRKVVYSAVAALLSVAAGLVMVESAHADGAIRASVEVVDGEMPGDGYWFILVPADIQQPIEFREAESYAQRTERASTLFSDIKPGSYLIAMIWPQPLLGEEIPDVLRVKTDIGIAEYPAKRVEVLDDAAQATEITFRVKTNPPPPFEFTPPDTGGGVDDSAEPVADAHVTEVTHEHRSDLILYAGIAIAGVSIVAAGGVFLYPRLSGRKSAS